MNKPTGPELQNSSGISAAIGNAKMLILALLAGLSLGSACSREESPEVKRAAKEVETINQKLAENLEACYALGIGDARRGIELSAGLYSITEQSKRVTLQLKALADRKSKPDLEKLNELSLKLNEEVLPKMEELGGCINEFCTDEDGKNLCREAEINASSKEQIVMMGGIVNDVQEQLETVSGFIKIDGKDLQLEKYALGKKKELLATLKNMRSTILDLKGLILDIEDMGYEGEDLNALREKANNQLMMIEVLIEVVDPVKPSSSNGMA